MTELTHEEIAQLKRIELEMLIELKKVCDLLHVRLFLLDGTLLGAVRHKGFIPWDDDIDVGLLREDYNTLMKQGATLFPSHLFLQTFWTDPEYSLNFAKLRNSNTTYLESSAKKLNINHGVFIDIFPIDYYPDSAFQKRIFEYKRSFYSFVIEDAFYYENAPQYSLKRRIAKKIAKTVYPSRKQALKKREALLSSIKKSSLIGSISLSSGEKSVVPAEVFMEYCELEFEGHYFGAPLQYDRYLTKVYGNYMELPPVNERIGHHYLEMFDPQRSYLEYKSLFGL